ncbi:NADH dehydrogenase [Desulfoplanes formicivorans]|uniref:NADH dehydrogenase n=2 Tax=Desulfoplanes formicivorans TaxID=1592317 RepID=A0A194AIF4_9BACT|nr:NADH dehydrogenase [Desulfoplanes formicivorans]
MTTSISIILNNIPCEGHAGQTILEVARANGIRIPTLCHHERLKPIGSCRLCMVEVEGSGSPVAACTTPARSGMIVRTHTPALEKLRRDTLLLLLVDHRLDCDSCELDGACRVQELARCYGITQAEIDQLGFCPVPRGPVTYGATPLITYHPDRCIRCGRCVKACEEISEQAVLSFAGRGAATTIAPMEQDGKFSGECLSCGECMAVCPVNALTETHVVEALPDGARVKKIRTICPYCGCGCTMDLRIHADHVLGAASCRGGVNDGSLCAKGRFGLEFIHSPERITAPLVRENGTLHEVSWEKALEFTALRLHETVRHHGPDRVAGLSSARCTNEENYLFQKLFRAVLGTNNVDHCARL